MAHSATNPSACTWLPTDLIAGSFRPQNDAWPQVAILRSPIFLPLYKQKKKNQTIENFQMQENLVLLKGKKPIFVNPWHSVFPQYQLSRWKASSNTYFLTSWFCSKQELGNFHSKLSICGFLDENIFAPSDGMEQISYYQKHGRHPQT